MLGTFYATVFIMSPQAVVFCGFYPLSLTG
jgi:hypothetical protein